MARAISNKSKKSLENAGLNRSTVRKIVHAERIAQKHQRDKRRTK